MAPNDYASQVAQMRAQRRQQEAQEQYQSAVYNHAEALSNRQEIEKQALLAVEPEDKAQLENDWHFYDQQVPETEAELQRLNPPQPKFSPQQAEFLRQSQPYVRKGGQQALNNIVQAHNRALAVGLRENSQPNFDHIKSNLELNGGASPEDTQELTPWEAAKASGISWNEYQRQSQIYWDKKRRGEI